MVPEPSKLIETLRGAAERECEAEINRLILDVQRETAEECLSIVDDFEPDLGEKIKERFGLKEPK